MALKKVEQSIPEIAEQVRTLSGDTQVSTYKVTEGVTVKVTEKDRRIVAQGIIQAVVQSPALIAFCSDLPTYKQTVKELAEDYIKWVWEKSS
jgi:DNA-binding ferritin-like protein